MEAESPRLSHEGKDRQNVRAVDAVASPRPSRRREDPGPLVEPERLAADPAPGGDFADQQAMSSHAWSLNPAPGVKVKSFRSRSQVDLAEAEGVADHGHRAERHGGAGNDRAQEQAEDGIEHTRGHRHPERV